MKLASAGPSQPAPPITNAIPPARAEVAETSNAVVAKAAETNKAEAAKVAMPPQPANHGTGQGILGVLPASILAQPAPSQASPSQASPSQALAYADPAPRAQPPAVAAEQRDQGRRLRLACHPHRRIIQVGALESESEAKQRIDLARTKASSLRSKADPFTEPGRRQDNKTLYRARFAGTRARSGRSGVAVRSSAPTFPALPFATDRSG